MKVRARYVVITGVIALFGVAFYYASGRSTAGDLDAMRKMGVAVDDTTFNSFQPTSGSNAAPIYQHMEKEIDDVGDKFSSDTETITALMEVFDGPNGPTPTDIFNARSAFQRIKPFADEARAASWMDRCYFGPSKLQSNPFYYDDPNYMNYFAAGVGCLVLAATALLESQQGNGEAAFNDLAAALRICSQFDRDPSPDAFNMGSDATYVLMAWRRVLDENGKNRAVLNASLDQLQRLGLPRDMKAFYFASYRASLDQYYWLEKQPNADPRPIYPTAKIKKIDGVLAQLMLRRAIQQQIHLDRLVFEWMPKDGTDLHGIHQALERGVAESKKHWPLSRFGPSSTYDSDEEQCETYDYIFGMRRMAYVSAKLLLMRLDGKLPETLPDFGSNGIDPLEAKPFLYQRTGNGFILKFPTKHPIVWQFH